jgi:tRNA (cmo5U34)-methyltransferase
VTLDQGWRSKDAPTHYANIVDVAVPARKDILKMIAGLVDELAPERPSVLDVGCGFGDVTAEVLQQIPQASLTLVDYSDEMIRLAGERFDGNPNLHILQHDLNNGLPGALQDRNFDAVVSCFVIHHVAYEQRVALYADIRRVLKPGGIFINGDLFRAEDATINEWEFDCWIALQVEQIRQKMGKVKTFEEVKQRQLESFRQLGDKPGTVWDMQRDLRSAGFHSVDCLWKFQNIAVLVAKNWQQEIELEKLS